MLRRLNIFKKYRVDERGATAVEFGLTGIFFMMLLMAVIEGGRIIWIMNSVEFSVGEASRYAALDDSLSSDEVQSYARDKLNNMMIDGDLLTVTFTTVTSSGVDFAQVDGSYDHQMMLSAIMPDSWSNFTITSSNQHPIITEE